MVMPDSELAVAGGCDNDVDECATCDEPSLAISYRMSTVRKKMVETQRHALLESAQHAVKSRDVPTTVRKKNLYASVQYAYVRRRHVYLCRMRHTTYCAAVAW